MRQRNGVGCCSAQKKTTTPASTSPKNSSDHSRATPPCVNNRSPVSKRNVPKIHSCGKTACKRCDEVREVLAAGMRTASGIEISAGPILNSGGGRRPMVFPGNPTTGGCSNATPVGFADSLIMTESDASPRQVTFHCRCYATSEPSRFSGESRAAREETANSLFTPA